MTLKIHVYIKSQKVKKVEIDLDGMSIKLDPKFIDMKRKVLYNPIANLMIPLHQDLVVYHYQ